MPDISVFLNLCAGDAECPWRAGAPTPLKVARRVSAVLDGKVYVFGGFFPKKAGDPPGPPDYSMDVYEYDVARNEWSKKAPMPIGFGFSTAAAYAIGDKIFVIVGWGTDGFRNDLLEYTPATDQWRTRAPRPTYRTNAATAAVNGKLYVLGGSGTIDDGPWALNKRGDQKSHVEIYDPASNSWTTGQAAPMLSRPSTRAAFTAIRSMYSAQRPTAALGAGAQVRHCREQLVRNGANAGTFAPGASCSAVDGALYIAGGEAGGGAEWLDLVERYDPLQQSWTSPTRLPNRRAFHLAAVVGSEIVFLGGENRPGYFSNTPTDLVEIVDTKS